MIILGILILSLEQLQLYTDARRQIAAFHHKYHEAIQQESLQPVAIEDIETKEFEMIQFDLEAVMRLEQWDDLDTVFSVSLKHCTCLPQS